MIDYISYDAEAKILASWGENLILLTGYLIMNFLNIIPMTLKNIKRCSNILNKYKFIYFRFLRSHKRIVLSLDAVAIISSYLLKSQDRISP